jgi:hypothetical protein
MATIEKRVRNGKATYRVRYRDPGGGQRSKVFARKADAQRFLNETETAKVRGTWTDPSLGRVLYRVVPPQAFLDALVKVLEQLTVDLILPLGLPCATVVPHHHDRAHVPFDRRPEHPSAQRADDFSASTFEEAALGWLPLELVGWRDIELSTDRGQVRGIGGYGVLWDVLR